MMKPVIAIMAPGNMGAAVGRVLTSSGLEVRTSLAGRGAASAKRAQDAGMRVVDDEQIALADIVLSIVPPAAALATVERVASLAKGRAHKPLYVDCNAISPDSAGVLAAVADAAQMPFVDGGIIGMPPREGGTGPRFYFSGAAADRCRILGEHGLHVRILDAPVGAASALKMSYAGITKGFIALGSAMVLAAARNGAAPALLAELRGSQPELYAWLAGGIPGMYSKAYRWVAEMNEIEQFIGSEQAENLLYRGAAGLYERLAADVAGPRAETGELDAFFARGKQGTGK
jgi:3-hydroxyisobutyrate dehydrogenase-like beta-hydroxyacid dehydrogenase